MMDVIEPVSLTKKVTDSRYPFSQAPTYAIVIPTYKESLNIEPLVARISEAMGAENWEVIFVDDDSPDETSTVVRRIARENARIRCIQRIGRRGLSSACIEGIMSTTAPFVIVMDADMQHDERLLPRMFQALRSGHYDVVVGSRYTPGGSVGTWDRRRVAISRATGALSRLLLRTELQDPMSGFFGVTRTHFETCVRDLSPDGFKILVDIFASHRGSTRFIEIPYQFRSRINGESKLDARVSIDFVKLLLEKSIGRYVPVTFLIFGFIGALGLVVHLGILGLLTGAVGTDFTVAQAVATLSAMVFNYLLNNSITYRDRRRTGWGLLTGLASFVLICSFGAVANVGIATILFREHPIWWLAGTAGAVVGSVWNYAMTSTFTWKKRA